jgi:LAS superfamily LD-carboxypeptidase LdcB
MFDPNDNSFFGDDAGFLAGLGIPLEEKKVEKKVTPLQKKEIVEVKSEEIIPEVPQEVVEEVKPSFGNAKVLRREEPKPETAKRTNNKPSRIEFSQGSLKEKARPTNEGSLFKVQPKTGT